MSVFTGLKEKWKALRRREKEKMQNMTFKQKASYICTAWGLEIVIGIVVLVVLGFGIYLIDNATNTQILSVGIVDSSISDAAIDDFIAEFKDYSGHTKRKEIVSVTSNIPSASGTLKPVEDVYLLEMQQFSRLLIDSGTMDCYIANDSYMQFLKDYGALITVKEALGAEMAEEYTDLMTEDGYGLVLSDTAEEYFCLEEGEYWLVYVGSIHYPEVVQSFTQFVMEK